MPTSRKPLRADASTTSTIDEDGDETMEGDPEESATQVRSSSGVIPTSHF